MRLFKPTYLDREGKKRKTIKWYLDFSTSDGIRHRLPLFADRRACEAVKRTIAECMSCKVGKMAFELELQRKLDVLPTRILLKLSAWGLLDNLRIESSKLLMAHISDYTKVLEAKGFLRDYVVRTENRLKKTIADCRFSYFRDITKSAVEIYSGKLKADGYSSTSRGHYLGTLKTFLNWAQLDQRIINNPIAKLENPARDSARKGILTPEQFVHLIKTTAEKNVLIGRTTGQERAVLYALAGCTGLRRRELLNLAWDDITLSEANAFVRVRASIAKNGKEALQPIPPAMVAVLQALKAHIKPNDNDKVFVSFGRWINTAGLIRDDLTTAQILLKDRDSNEICFHSLRNSYISFLANSTTPAKIIQKLARHSDPRLTFNTYARTFEEGERQAVRLLPDFHFATSFAKQCVSERTDLDYSGQINHIGDRKTPILVVNQIPPRGVEPLLPG